MPHALLQNQNHHDLIKLLRASSVAYKKAKSKEFIFTYILMFLALAYPIVYIFIKDEGLKQSLFGISFLVTVSTWFLTDYFKGNTSKGAILKEEFDVQLFQLPWKFLLHKVEPVEVLELSEQYKGKPIRDWYPSSLAEYIPNNTAIAVCQRISTGWDIKLRSTFGNLLLKIVIVYSLFVILLWALTSANGRTIFLMYFSILSFYSHIFTLIRGNSSAIKKRTAILIKLDDYIDNKKVFTSENLRDIQDEMYSIRQEPAKVPDFICSIYNGRIYQKFEEYIQEINEKYISSPST